MIYNLNIRCHPEEDRFLLSKTEKMEFYMISVSRVTLNVSPLIFIFIIIRGTHFQGSVVCFRKGMFFKNKWRPAITYTITLDEL